MTTTIRAWPVVDGLADVDPARRPRCEALLQCAEQCCDPVPCRRPAAARVSFACEATDCDRATHVLLLCSVCADGAEANVPPPARRPL